MDTQSDLSFVPSVITSITVAGRDFEAVTYKAEYTGEFRDTWNTGVYEHQVFYYKIVDTYDKISGILLRSESYVTWGPCSTDNTSSPICMSGAMTGKTSSIILELSEIYMP